MGARTVHLLTQSFPERGVFDMALSRALLLLVDEGKQPETLRLHRPGPVVSFGAQDARAPGFPQAVEAARAAGFRAALRLGGGRAAVFHQDTVAFAWTVPDDEPRVRIHERYQEIAGLIATALRGLGVDARIGEVPGEYARALIASTLAAG